MASDGTPVLSIEFASARVGEPAAAKQVSVLSRLHKAHGLLATLSIGKRAGAILAANAQAKHAYRLGMLGSYFPALFSGGA